MTAIYRTIGGTDPIPSEWFDVDPQDFKRVYETRLKDLPEYLQDLLRRAGCVSIENIFEEFEA